ncbi:MAG TPA: hypothetical protein VHA37_00440 [Candidatus Saccharimonadales bacterium]|nr:hypothetical protein [Candidatus Saccharimonadales bacterium]
MSIQPQYEVLSQSNPVYKVLCRFGCTLHAVWPLPDHSSDPATYGGSPWRPREKSARAGKFLPGARRSSHNLALQGSGADRFAAG